MDNATAAVVNAYIMRKCARQVNMHSPAYIAGERLPIARAVGFFSAVRQSGACGSGAPMGRQRYGGTSIMRGLPRKWRRARDPPGTLAPSGAYDRRPKLAYMRRLSAKAYIYNGHWKRSVGLGGR